MSTEICRPGEGHNLRPLECRLYVGIIYPEGHENIVDKKL